MRQPEISRRSPRAGPLLWLLQALVVVGALLSRRPVGRLPRGVDAADLAEGYEHGDVRPAALLGGAAALVVIMGIVLVVITAFEAAETGLPPSISRPQDLIQGLQAAPAPTPPAPRLEGQPGQSFAPYRAAQEGQLSQYRWIDRQAGRVAMPIDRAMDVLSAQGLPVRQAAPPTAHDHGDASPSSASSGRVAEAYP